LEIKAVVFDYGRVISFDQDPEVLDELAKLAGVEKDKFISALWALRGDYDRGLISSRKYFTNVLSSLSVCADDKTLDKMAEIDIGSWKNVNPETVALMEEVKKAGYILGILSNIPLGFLDWARKNSPVFSLPHIGLYSCEVNHVKPEKVIFEKLVSMTGVKAGELVFFDDLAKNIKGARDIGIEAFIWENPKKARRELLSLGVKL